MRSIALTGSIASGKSTVLRLFREQGIATVDCDAIVSQLYNQKSIQEKILKKFKTKDKRQLSEIIFSDSKKRKALESILHPEVLKRVKKKLNAFKKKSRAVVIVDVPLLFEAKLQHLFDAVIVVKATQKQQLQRLKQQGFSRKQALQRIKAQLPLRKKIKRANYVIDNSSSIKKTKKQVTKLMCELNA